MEEFEEDLQVATDALERLSLNSGLATAEALEAAFQRTGASIERALSQAAKSGEVDFKRMAEAIIADIARITAEAILAQTSLGTGNQVQTTSLIGGASNTLPGASSTIASVIASAAAKGGRFL